MASANRTTVLSFAPMQRITSRQNPLVARYRDAARGDADGRRAARRRASRRRGARRRRRDSASRRSRRRARAAPMIARICVEPSAQRAVDVVASRAGDGRAQPGAIGQRDRRARRAPAGSRRRVYAAPSPLVVIAVRRPGSGQRRRDRARCRSRRRNRRRAAGACADPFGWKALRGSMGSALRLPIARAATRRRRSATARAARLPDRRDRAARRQRAVRRRAHRPGGAAGRRRRRRPAASARRRGRRRASRSRWQPPVESLNAAVAAALMLYEARRQRMQPLLIARLSRWHSLIGNARSATVMPDGFAVSDDEPPTLPDERAHRAAGRADAAAHVRRVRRPGGAARARQAAARGDRTRSAAVDHPVGAAGHRQDDARADHRRHDARRGSSRSAPCSPASRKSAR